MSSSAVKNDSLRFVLALLTLVVGAAAEELLPKFLGLGFPVLLSAVPVLASRRPLALSVIYALAAGGVEDSLSALPFLTSASVFLVLSALARWTRLPHLVAVFAYPAYQVWLCLWCSGLQGGFFGRFLLAFPLGALTSVAVTAALLWCERKAAVDEAG